MAPTLAAAVSFAPWRSEAASQAAAWLAPSAPDPIDAIRGDLDTQLPRELPTPDIDARLRRTRTLAPPSRSDDWAAIEAYAEAAIRSARTWAVATGAWESGYSGPDSLVDHVVLGLLRDMGVVGRWTAHVSSLLSHGTGGRLRAGRTVPGAFRNACAQAIGSADVSPPVDDTVAAWVLTLIAALADEVVVGTDALGSSLVDSLDAGPLRDRLTGRVRVWERPALVPTAPFDAGKAAGRTRAGETVVTARVDEGTLVTLGPVLAAYGLLDPDERSAVALRLITNRPDLVSAEVRWRGLEEAVAVEVDRSPARPREGAALVLDAPVPEGLTWSPSGRPELSDRLAEGGRVLLVCPQDSPLARTAGVTHIPAEHVHAARAAFSRLARDDRG